MNAIDIAHTGIWKVLTLNILIHLWNVLLTILLQKLQASKGTYVGTCALWVIYMKTQNIVAWRCNSLGSWKILFEWGSSCGAHLKIAQTWSFQKTWRIHEFCQFWVPVGCKIVQRRIIWRYWQSIDDLYYTLWACSSHFDWQAHSRKSCCSSYQTQSHKVQGQWRQ